MIDVKRHPVWKMNIYIRPPNIQPNKSPSTPPTLEFLQWISAFKIGKGSLENLHLHANTLNGILRLYLETNQTNNQQKSTHDGYICIESKHQRMRLFTMFNINFQLIWSTFYSVRRRTSTRVFRKDDPFSCRERERDRQRETERDRDRETERERDPTSFADLTIVYK